jgi:uncharacterized protein (UPF0548 family)
VFLLHAPNDDRVREWLRSLVDVPCTHDCEGVTRAPIDVAPPGFTLDAYSAELGRGEATFARAKAAIGRFEHYPRSFSRVVPLAGGLVPGLVFGTVARHLGFASLHPCRVLFVVDEPRRFGFGLGTLPGHVAIGEETFLVSLDGEDERVQLEVRAVSRPAGLLARLGRPIMRAYQRRFQRELCTELRQAAAHRGGPE